MAAKTYWAQPVALTGQRLRAAQFVRASERETYRDWLLGRGGWLRARRGIWYVSQWETGGVGNE